MGGRCKLSAVSFMRKMFETFLFWMSGNQALQSKSLRSFGLETAILVPSKLSCFFVGYFYKCYERFF
jgi:hypothetical protein